MEGDELHLNRTWHVGPLLGGGGFGKVYEVTDDAPGPAVAKFVPKEPGAERELLLVSTGSARNVVPVIDSGEHRDYWVLVMPRAEMSLRDHLSSLRRPMTLDECVIVLTDIAAALTDLDGAVVHRDVKPENVLLLDGHWCLADFGISRYAEASTAPDTRKYAMSTAYAAPERWRMEHAGIACDVYALGIMGYEMIAGSRPFNGSDAQLRDQHLHDTAAPLVGQPVAFTTLIDECLYKSPDARPRPANLLARLESLSASAVRSLGLAALQQANQDEVQRRADSDQQESRAQSAFDRRRELFGDAERGFRTISEQLRAAIVSAAPSINELPDRDGKGWTLTLDGASLSLSWPRTWSEPPWGNAPAPVFEVVAAASIGIKQPPDRSGYEGRSHSLWFADAQEVSAYGWFETAFMISPLVARRAAQEPFARAPGHESGIALAPMMAEYQAAWPFTRLSLDDLSEFIDRWAGWFATAATSRLSVPSRMPERSVEGSWRR